MDFTFQKVRQILMIVAYVILIGIIIFYHPSYLKINSSLSSEDTKYTLKIFCILVALIGLLFLLGFLKFKINLNIGNSMLLLAYLLIIIAPAEEILFRGLIQSELVSKIGPIFGLVLASAIFGLAHLPNGATGVSISLWNWKLALVSGVGGIFLGLVFMNTASILYPVVMHALLGLIYFIFLK